MDTLTDAQVLELAAHYRKLGSQPNDLPTVTAQLLEELVAKRSYAAAALPKMAVTTVTTNAGESPEALGHA